VSGGGHYIQYIVVIVSGQVVSQWQWKAYGRTHARVYSRALSLVAAV